MLLPNLNAEVRRKAEEFKRKIGESAETENKTYNTKNKGTVTE